MRSSNIALIGSLNFFFISPAFSQSKTCPNYWINPNTGLEECLNQKQSIPITTIPSNSNNSSTSSSNQPCAGLKLDIESFGSSAGGAFTKVFGTVKNRGNQTYRYIEINIQYLENNRIVDDGFTLVQPGVLSPGQTGTWSNFTTNNRVTKVKTTSMTCKLA
jgi:hypothetical protein